MWQNRYVCIVMQWCVKFIIIISNFERSNNRMFLDLLLVALNCSECNALWDGLVELLPCAFAFAHRREFPYSSIPHSFNEFAIISIFGANFLGWILILRISFFAVRLLHSKCDFSLSHCMEGDELMHEARSAQGWDRNWQGGRRKKEWEVEKGRRKCRPLTTQFTPA